MNGTNKTILYNTNKTSLGHFGKSTKGLFIAVFTINVPLTILGNISLCWVVYKYQRLRTPNNMLIASLSCANMLNVFTFISRLIIYFSPEVESAFCSTLVSFCKSILLLTTLHLCLISVDRMLAIKYPLRYPLWVTNRRALFLVILLWVVVAIILGVQIVQAAREQTAFWKNITRCHGKNSSNRGQYKRKAIKVKVSPIVFGYIIPLLVMVTSYGMIFKVVKTQSSKAYPETQKQAKRKAELKAAKTIGVVIGAFVLLYTPVYFYSALRAMSSDGETLAVPKSKRKILHILGSLSSCASWINPVIYAFTSKDVKEQFKKLFKGFCRKNN